MSRLANNPTMADNFVAQVVARFPESNAKGRSIVESLRGLNSYLAGQILGQGEVIAQVTELLQRSFCGIRLPNRPLASMLFLGPTGVGKTETAELLTERLFGSRERLVRLDMSEYMTVDSIDILRGANMAEDGILGRYHDRTEGTGVLL